jgi:hypothetical protein
MSVDVSTTQSPVAVSVNDTTVSVVVSGGIGPQGPAGGNYTLPAATTSTLGGIIVGSNLTVTADGTLSATGGGAVSSVAGRTGAVTLTTADISGLGSLATQSGTFSGTSSGTNTGDQTITLTGDVTGSGTGSFAATLAASGATAGTYTSVTVDTKGRVTSGTNPAGYSLPTASASVLGGIKIGSGLSIDAGGVVTASVTSVAGRTGAVTIASSDVSGLAASATTDTTSAANISSGTLPDERLSSAVALSANLLGVAHNSSTAIDTIPRSNAIASNQIATGQMWISFFTPAANITVNTFTFYSGATATQTGVTYFRFGLYTYVESTGVMTLVAQTTTDTGIFAAANSAYARSFSAAGGASSYTLEAGSRYAVAVLGVFTGGAYTTLQLNTGLASVASQRPRTMFSVAGQSTLPSSYTVSGTSGNGFITYARLSFV